MVQTMKRSRKQRIDAAIAYALDRRWDLAATENRALLDEFPDDLEAANRLGKALTELGDLNGAVAAYQRSLVLDATNVIARRNLTRIEEMKGSQPKRRAPRRTGRTAGAPASVETVRAPLVDRGVRQVGRVRPARAGHAGAPPRHGRRPG